MDYSFNKIVNVSFDTTLNRVKEELKKEGFGVLTEINVQETLKKKLSVDINKYYIMGACNPPFAHMALECEPRIGTMLPCNVVVRETDGGEVEVSAIDPIVSMMAVENLKLAEVAAEVRSKLKRVVDNL